jgi:hypothetical protein
MASLVKRKGVVDGKLGPKLGLNFGTLRASKVSNRLADMKKGAYFLE